MNCGEGSHHKELSMCRVRVGGEGAYGVAGKGRRDRGTCRKVQDVVRSLDTVLSTMGGEKPLLDLSRGWFPAQGGEAKLTESLQNQNSIHIPSVPGGGIIPIKALI
jgi:hypothetical protein